MAKKANRTAGTERRYINPLTDFGFKRIFGSEANKDLLIDFLNAVLEIDGGIVDLRYDNPERQGRAKIDRRAIFDLYCVTGKGEHVIVEMQNVQQDYFKDRVLYYASFPIQEQGQRKKDWDFQLTPVYSVNILNFKFGKNSDEEGQYFHYVQLTDKFSNRVFYDKLALVFMELPNFTKKEHELKNNIDRWLYLLKYLAEMQNLPNVLHTNIFVKLCHVAEFAKMTRNEIKKYDQSLKQYRDMYLMETALQRKEALLKEKDAEIQVKDVELQEKDVELQEKDVELQEKDVELQKAKLALKTKDETMVHVLFEAGVSVEKIASSTGLSMKEINRIIKAC